MGRSTSRSCSRSLIALYVSLFVVLYFIIAHTAPQSVIIAPSYKGLKLKESDSLEGLKDRSSKLEDKLLFKQKLLFQMS